MKLYLYYVFCRSRREAFNSPLIAKVGDDTAATGPPPPPTPVSMNSYPRVSRGKKLVKTDFSTSFSKFTMPGLA